MKRNNVQWWVAAGIIMPALAWAQAPEAFIPSGDDELLETLAPAGVEAAADAIKARLANDPQNPALQKALIEEYIRLGKQEADTRYHGMAENLLKPYVDNSSPSSEMLLLWADILQYRHDFEKALIVLGKVLALDPRHARAHLMRAVIYQSQGRLHEAESDCRALFGQADLFTPTICLMQVNSLRGQLKEGYRRLAQIYDQFATQAVLEEKLWALTVLAEMASRAGDDAEAERYFKAALAVKPDDYYALAAYSEFLLAASRPQEVLALLPEPFWKIDKLFLQRVLAEKALKLDAFAAHRDQLEARFRLSREVGENTHLREHARFYLWVMDDKPFAHDLAKRNWTMQKEPADAVILAQTSLAMNDRDTALALFAELEQRKLEDRALAALKERFP